MKGEKLIREGCLFGQRKGRARGVKRKAGKEERQRQGMQNCTCCGTSWVPVRQPRAVCCSRSRTRKQTCWQIVGVRSVAVARESSGGRGGSAPWPLRHLWAGEIEHPGITAFEPLPGLMASAPLPLHNQSCNSPCNINDF